MVVLSLFQIRFLLLLTRCICLKSIPLKYENAVPQPSTNDHYHMLQNANYAFTPPQT